MKKALAYLSNPGKVVVGGYMQNRIQELELEILKLKKEIEALKKQGPRAVVHTHTGKLYDSIREASRETGYSYMHVVNSLKSRVASKVPLMYLEDYIKKFGG